MKLYIGSYWQPFPESEYGGVWAVLAKDVVQAAQLLNNAEHGDPGDLLYEDQTSMILDCVINAECFVVLGEETPRVVKFFRT